MSRRYKLKFHDSPGVVSPAVSVSFGALTRSGAGGVAIPSGATLPLGGTATGYTIVSGFVVPSSHGSATSGTLTFTGSTETWDITAISNAYSVKDGELAEVLALGSATIDGKTIYGREGADIGNSGHTVLALTSTLSFTTGLTITSHNTNSPCYIRRMSFAHAGNITFSNVIIRDEYVLADSFDSSAIWLMKNNATGRSGLTVTDSEIYSNLVTTLDMTTVIVSGTNAAHTNGVSNTVITLTGSPDLSGVLTDRSMAVRIGTSNRTIVGVDNGAKTITVSAALTIALASAQTYQIVYTPQILRWIGQDNGITNKPDLSVTGCNIHDFGRGIVGNYRSLNIVNNDFDQAAWDHLSLNAIGDETLLNIERNRFKRNYGKQATDPLNPHVDCIQYNLATMTQDNAVAYVFKGNIVFPGGGRAHDQHGVFLEGTPDARRVLVDIKHNLIMTNAQHGITVERPASGSVISYNTILRDQNTGGTNPRIDTLGSPTTTIDSGVTIEYNATPSINATAATETSNHEYATNDNAGYAALFTGTDFDSDVIATVAAFRTAATPDGNLTLWPAVGNRIGALGGYYNYDTGVESLP